MDRRSLLCVRAARLGALTFALPGALLLTSGSARATPRPLPFSYPPQVLPAESFEGEQIIDTTPVRVAREDPSDTKAVTSLRWHLETEFEYGLTDWLELSWYLAFDQSASAQSPFLQFQGVKQRARAQLADRGEWPIDLGVYVEIAEFHDEVEFEQKLLLGKRLGRLDLIANLWGEQEYYFQEGDWKFVYNPTAGVTYELSPHFNVGVEYWARGRFDAEATNGRADSAADARHYLGPTFLAQRGEYFLSVGAYARLDRLGKSQRLEDPWGNIWVRAMLGIGL